MSDKQLERIRADFKKWAKQPPRRSAAAARTRVLTAIDNRRRLPTWRPATAAILVTAGLAMTAIFVVPRLLPGGPLNNQPVPGPVASAVSEDAARPLLIYELRSGTKLYLALSRHSKAVAADSPEREQGDES